MHPRHISSIRVWSHPRSTWSSLAWKSTTLRTLTLAVVPVNTTTIPHWTKTRRPSLVRTPKSRQKTRSWGEGGGRLVGSPTTASTVTVIVCCYHYCIGKYWIRYALSLRLYRWLLQYLCLSVCIMYLCSILGLYLTTIQPVAKKEIGIDPLLPQL